MNTQLLNCHIDRILIVTNAKAVNTTRLIT